MRAQQKKINEKLVRVRIYERMLSRKTSPAFAVFVVVKDVVRIVGGKIRIIK